MVSSSAARARDLFVVHTQVQLERFGNLAANGQNRIQGGHRVLEDHRDFRPPNQALLILRQLEQVPSAKDYFAFGNFAWRLRDQAHNRECMHTLAATAFAYHTESFSLVQDIGNAVNGVDGSFFRMKTSFEVL